MCMKKKMQRKVRQYWPYALSIFIIAFFALGMQTSKTWDSFYNVILGSANHSSVTQVLGKITSRNSANTSDVADLNLTDIEFYSSFDFADFLHFEAEIDDFGTQTKVRSGYFSMQAEENFCDGADILTGSENEALCGDDTAHPGCCECDYVIGSFNAAVMVNPGNVTADTVAGAVNEVKDHSGAGIIEVTTLLAAVFNKIWPAAITYDVGAVTVHESVPESLPFEYFKGTAAGDNHGNISTMQGDGSVIGPKDDAEHVGGGWRYAGMVRVRVNDAEVWMPYYEQDIWEGH